MPGKNTLKRSGKKKTKTKRKTKKKMSPNAILEDLIIVNKLGLHARAAAKFVQLASQFQSEITLAKDGITANGKSIMGILMLAAEKGSSVTLAVDGDDAAAAFAALKKIIKDGFGE